MSLRQHQKAVRQQAIDLASKRKRNFDLFTEVIPGGGKSRNVSILANQLRSSNLAKSVIWITPRRSLQAQAVQSAAEADNPKHRFRLGENHRNPRPDGFATNFSSLLHNPEEHLVALKRIQGPTLLVVDEIHFIQHYGPPEEFRGWAQAFSSLRKEVFSRGGSQLSMTGTARRWDSKPVVNTPYDPDLQSHLHIDRLIKYDRQMALDEGAIVRIQPQFFDGHVQYNGPDGIEPSTPRLLSSIGMLPDDTNKLVNRSLRAFLSYTNVSSVHIPVIWDAITRRRKGWLHTKKIYGNNQIIIIVDRQETAVEIVNTLNSSQFRSRVRKSASSFGTPFDDEFRALLAVSNDSNSRAAIASFRSGRLKQDFKRRKTSNNLTVNAAGSNGQQVHCLVTVAMAHVGMDAPMATHMVALGVSRSIPWLTQAFARVWRSGNYKWPKGRKPLPVKDRMSYIWMPKDIRMIPVLEAIGVDSYANGISKQQRAGAWHDLPDPMDGAYDLDAIESYEAPKSSSREASAPMPCTPVSGVSSITAIQEGTAI